MKQKIALVRAKNQQIFYNILICTLKTCDMLQYELKY
jgi:hypothetical protein